MKEFLLNWQKTINNAANKKEAYTSFIKRLHANFKGNFLDYYFLPNNTAVRVYHISGNEIVKITTTMDHEIFLKFESL